MKINIKIIFIFTITYIFFLLGEFCIKAGTYVIPIYFFVGILYLLLLYIKYPKTINHKLHTLYKTNIGKILLLFVFWTFVTIIVSIFQGTFIFSSFISNYIGNFFNSFLFPLFIGFLTVTMIKSYKPLNKILFFTFYSILILGIIEYIGIKYNISFIKEIFSILVNRVSILTSQEKLFIMAYEKPRIATIFGEPGELANFLVTMSPIYFYFFKIKKNFISLLLFLLFIINLILTQSPINLVFFAIITLFASFNTLKNLYIKHKRYFLYSLSIIFTILLILSSIIFKIDTSNSYITRITKVVQNIKSINSLILAEASLGTRICTYEAQIRMGIDHPIFGVGYANMNSLWGKYILKLPHYITPEVYRYAIANTQKGGAAFIWKIFAETGFVGVILLYTFWIILLLKAKQTIKFAKNKELIKAFYYSLLIYFCFSFYLALLPIFLIHFGILMGLIYNENKFKPYQKRTFYDSHKYIIGITK